MLPPSDPPAASGSLRLIASQAWRLIRILRPYWRRIFKSLALGLVGAALTLVLPWSSKLFFDDVYRTRDISFLHILVIGTALMSVMSAIVGGLKTYYGQLIGSYINAELGLMFFTRIQHIETRFFDERRVGDVLSRGADLQRATGFVTDTIQRVLVNLMFIVLVPPILFALNWQLALLALVASPASTCIALAAGPRVRRLSRAASEKSADATGYQVETLSNIRLIKSLAAEYDVFDGSRKRIREARLAQQRTFAVIAMLGLAQAVIQAAGVAIYSWVSWSFILDGRLTLGSFVLFSSYLGFVKGPVTQVVSLYANIQQGSVALSRFFEYYDAPLEQPASNAFAARRKPGRRILGEVIFDRVTFRFSPDQPVLENASFEIHHGQMTALVGQSGVGKSSIVKLILRMYRQQRGEIWLDGRRISEFALDELRGQIGVVWQENGMLCGTLRENLSLGSNRILTDSELARPIALAQLDGLIAALPAGLDTTVAEWGATLSGGQRQRFAIARALAREAPFIILDEATANLDESTEARLVESMAQELSARTIVWVTHRRSVAASAHRVLHLTQWNVGGGQSHSRLLDADSCYRDFWGDESRLRQGAVFGQECDVGMTLDRIAHVPSAFSRA